jgi:NAD(P)-dependent dehydrogenase (short-subunit alcohol dehydrogenase family)
MDQLKGALEQAPCEATLSSESARADKQSLSTLKTFTRLGYSSSQKAWQPVTERMEGLHVVLTGANSGIGLAAAIDLAMAGADLTLVVRSQEKAEATLRVLSDETGRSDFNVELADLSLLKATDSLARRLLEHGRPIDVLINNAGALFNEHSLTEEGLERSYALLLLSPWRLTEALMPLLADHKKSSRVINVVSGGMYAERLNVKRLNVSSDGYRGARAYAQCKRALNTLTEIWATRWAGHNIIVNAMHPGWSDTPGVQTALPLFRKITRLVLRSHKEGADTVVWMAQSDQAGLSSGKLFLDRQPRSPYLLGNNVEAPEQRTALEAQLSEDHLKVANRSPNA